MALTRRFGSVVAVDGLDLEVPERSVFGFLGRNGAGKTTTIRVLLGLLRPTSGTAALFGVDIARRIEAVRNVGSLIETPPHYDHLTARENLAITARLLRQPKAEIERVLEVVSLASSADRRVGGFSMGMRQRLGVARALLGRPRLLILDEPTNGLDPDGILDMRSLINALPEEQGVTLLISSHILAEVEQTATHLALLDGGRLVTQGSVASLMAGQPRSVSIKARNTGKLLELLDEIGVEGTVHAPDAVQLAPGCADKVAQDIPALNFLMVERGIEVLGLEVREPSLEQFFQREVRRSARERAATSSLPLAA
jgi:ABC-2 type transport system ATP-binding protein